MWHNPWLGRPPPQGTLQLRQAIAHMASSEVKGPDPITEAAAGVADFLNADVFVYNGPIDFEPADALFDSVNALSKRRPNVALVLTTSGGSGDAGFRMARFLKRKYERFTLLLFGWCKSAGTLIALGADQIVMSDYAEMGPLDVQVYKEDDFFGMSSGLDLHQALQLLSSQTYVTFEQCLFQILNRTGGAISTKTAAQIASEMAVGMLSPVAGQIDPLRLGELNRALKVAEDYGRRLSDGKLDHARQNAIRALTLDYPSHSFVIDQDEAQRLLGNVRELADEECLLERMLHDSMRWELPQKPQKQHWVSCISPPLALSNDENQPDSAPVADGQSSNGLDPGPTPRDAGTDESAQRPSDSDVTPKRSARRKSKAAKRNGES